MPSLAHSWATSNDGLRVTFKLRQDVHFHKTDYFTPTRKLKAIDVVFSFKKMLDKTHPYHKADGETYAYLDSIGLNKLIKDVFKKSDHEVVFVLNEADATFLTHLSSDFASILSQEYADQLMKEKQQKLISSKPIGTGPFKFVDYQKDKKVLFYKNESYFGGLAQASKLKFLITPDSSERMSLLKQGKCHLVKNLSERDYKMEGFKYVKAPGVNTGYLAFNLRKEKLQNKSLRKAISLALNRSSYLSSVYKNNAVLAKSPLPPQSWAHDQSLQDFEYNLSKARKLMEESGVDTPLTLTLWTLPVSRPYNPDGRLMGAMIKRDLRTIGIDLKLLTFDWPTFLDKMRKGDEHELVLYGWSSDNGDPDSFMNILLSCQGAEGGSNVSGYCNKEYDHLIGLAKKTLDRGKRTALYKKAQRKFVQDLPFIPVAHSSLFRVMSSEVENYEITSLGTEAFKNVRLSSWK